MPKKFLFSGLLLSVSMFGVSILNAGDPIPVTEIKRTEVVDFDKEILPMLRQNCLACHNATDAEGDVVLESVEQILKSESVVPGKPDDSKLLVLSMHGDDPVMPPEDNDVKAKNLTSDQLGLIKLWIAGGAKPSANSNAKKVNFAKLPSGINPVYSLAMSPDGQYLVAGRANQVFVYQVPSKKLITRVTDPEILSSSIYKKPGVAHMDLVQSLAFAPDNRTFVSGGFRTVKIWRRSPIQTAPIDLKFPEPLTTSNSNNARSHYVLGSNAGTAFIVSAETQNATSPKTVPLKISTTIKTGDKPIDFVAISESGSTIAVVTEKTKLNLYDTKSEKLIGSEIALASDAVSVCFGKNDQSILVGQTNKAITIYSLAAITANPKEPIQPTKTLNGNGQPPHLIASYSENQAKLISGANDGNIKLWDLNSGAQIRTFSHGTAICGIEVSDDEKYLASCGTNGSLKIWDATNSKLIKEVRGDALIDFQLSENDRRNRLKQKLIDAAKADLDAGNKEKTAEEANVKKTEEALKKADEETKKKLDAKTKSTVALTAAKKTLDAKKTEAVNVTKTKTDLVAQIKSQNDSVATLAAGLKELSAKLTQHKADKAKQTKQLKTANEQLAKDDKNETFKKAVEQANASLVKLNTAISDGSAQKTAKENEKKSAEAKSKMMTAQVAELDKKNNAITAEIKKQEAALKGPTDAEKKATDEYNVAARNSMLAKGSVERAKTRAKNAADQIPVFEAAHKAATNSKTEQEKKSNDFKTKNEKSLGSLTGILSLPDNRIAYFDSSGNVGVCDFATGEKLDSINSPEIKSTICFASNSGPLVWIATDGTKSTAMQTQTQWTLAKTIGNIDDSKTFSDRVTALDISANGKFLATGTGEPSRSGEIKIWNLQDGSFVKQIADAHSDTILDIRFSPDGKKIASSSSDRFMKTFDVETGKLIRVFEGHTHHVMSVDWNAIGRELTTAGADKVVKVWDAGTGTQKRTIAGYTKEVTSLCFVELTDEVLTGSGDKSVRRKRTNNGGEVRSFGGSSDFVYAVASSSDGKRLAAAGQDSIVRVWTDNGQIFAEFAPPKE